MAKRIATERDVHRAAFATYLEMGDGRTLLAVARKAGISHTAVKNWARSFGWTQRLAEHEATVARRAIDIADADGVETDARARARNLKMVQMAMLKLAQAVASGQVRFQMADLDRLVRLERLLTEGVEGGDRGDAAPAIDEDLAGLTDRELWTAMVEEVDAIRRIAEWDEQVATWVAEGKVRPIRALDPPSHCAGCGRPLAPDEVEGGIDGAEAAAGA